MAEKYFVNIETLKENSLIEKNVDTKKLTVILKRCQKQDIGKMLGSEMYTDILDKTDSDGLNPIETELVEEWLIPYLTIKVEQASALLFNIDIRNKSVGKSNDEYQTASDDTSIDKFQNDLRKQAQFYKSGLVDFIKDNSDSFPLYPSDCSEVEGAGDSHSYVFGTVVNMVH